jgi:hypothetical protein
MDRLRFNYPASNRHLGVGVEPLRRPSASSAVSSVARSSTATHRQTQKPQRLLHITPSACFVLAWNRESSKSQDSFERCSLRNVISKKRLRTIRALSSAFWDSLWCPRWPRGGYHHLLSVIVHPKTVVVKEDGQLTWTMEPSLPLFRRIVVGKALALCCDSNRACCTTIGTSDSITLASRSSWYRPALLTDRIVIPCLFCERAMESAFTLL